jgi:DNA polymerase III epsilon subunit-like protein
MYIYLDTETTGTGLDDRLCQIAFKADDGPAICELFNPGKPISIDAMAIHHITNKMVEDKPPFMGSRVYDKLKDLLDDENNVIVAHNAKFDMQMLHMEGISSPRVICTLKLAGHLDSAGVIPKYNLQYLRYYLGLEIDAKAHDALGDIIVLEAVFKRIQAKFVANGLENPVQEMIKISNNPILIPRMPFGKHKGSVDHGAVGGIQELNVDGRVHADACRTISVSTGTRGRQGVYAVYGRIDRHGPADTDAADIRLDSAAVGMENLPRQGDRIAGLNRGRIGAESDLGFRNHGYGRRIFGAASRLGSGNHMGVSCPAHGKHSFVSIFLPKSPPGSAQVGGV